MLSKANALYDQLVRWRRDFHMHPELSFQEERTARVVAATLEEMGLEVQTGVAKTGVVAYLGEGKPVIGIRADMDALPILEENEVEYASKTPGVMHACGHDAHTAMLLGAAKLLLEMENRPPGQIRFFFQPSEEDSDSENKSGALRMVEEGALEGVDAVIALHVASDLPLNRIMIDDGYVMAAEDSFWIRLTGTGGHGAFPHQGSDPTFILAQVINAIYGIRSRRIDPTLPAIISIGSIHAGQAANVIPSTVEITGTMRSFDDATRERQKEELASALQVAKALGGDFELLIDPGYPAPYNDPAVVAVLRNAVLETLGEGALVEPQKIMAAEDFSYMTRKVPGAMFFLGAALPGEMRGHHTPVFDIDELALPTGAALLAEGACRLLRRQF